MTIRGNPEQVDFQFLLNLSLGGLYAAFNFPSLAEFIVAIEQEAPEAEMDEIVTRLQATTGFTSTKRGIPKYYNFVESFPAVICSDARNPTDYQVWSDEADTADETGYFGSLWTWVSSVCAQYTTLVDENRYDGAFTADTANPVLVIGNLQDPATPYEGAVASANLLPNSFLVTADVPGHTSLGLSTCAQDIVGQYLLDPQTTADTVGTTTCPQEFNPFDLLAPPPAEEISEDPNLGRRARAKLMKEIAFSP